MLSYRAKQQYNFPELHGPIIKLFQILLIHKHRELNIEPVPDCHNSILNPIQARWGWKTPPLDVDSLLDPLGVRIEKLYFL
jgi:hypothetical protein